MVTPPTPPIESDGHNGSAPLDWGLIALWIVAILGSIGTYLAFRNYAFEDSYITFRYAKNLASGDGFTFTPGERVLGTTTPLLALLLGLCGKIGLSIEAMGYGIFAASLGAIGILGGSILRSMGSPILAVGFALLIVAGFGDTLTYFGMETSLYAALLFGAALALLREKTILAGVLVGLAFLTRYDAAIFAITMFGLLAIKRRSIPWKAGIISTLVVLPWLAFATWYFGSPLPNTLAAKVGDTGFLEYIQRSAVRVGNLSWRLVGVPVGTQDSRTQAMLIVNSLVGVGLISLLLTRKGRTLPLPSVNYITPLTTITLTHRG